MDTLFKLCAIALVSLVLLLVLEKQEKHIAVLMAVAVCCILIMASTSFLRPLIDLIKQLAELTKLELAFFSPVIKAGAAGFACEITSMVCTEAGYSSLGKTVQLIGVTLIIYFSLPLISGLLELSTEILGGI